jgi:hypothetical protein
MNHLQLRPGLPENVTGGHTFSGAAGNGLAGKSAAKHAGSAEEAGAK